MPRIILRNIVLAGTITESYLQILVGVLFLVGISQSHAENLLDTVVAETDRGYVEGSINWTNGTLTVFGEAAAPTRFSNPVQQRLAGFRAAKVIAYRNLAEIVGQVYIDSKTNLSMSTLVDDSVQTRIKAVVKGARVLQNTRQEENGLYRLALQLDLRGSFSDAILPDSSTAMPIPGEIPNGDSLFVFVPTKPHTGLVVDARGTDLRPSLSPQITDVTGRVIYSAAHVNRDYAINIGIVGYERDIQQATVSDRIGGENANPYVVKAVEVKGIYNDKVVLSRDSGTRVLMADMDGNFLSQCRVIFVVGTKPAPVTINWGIDTTYADSVIADSLDMALHRLLGMQPPQPQIGDTLRENEFEEIFRETENVDSE